MHVAVVNTGASTLKLALIELARGGARPLHRAERDCPAGEPIDAVLEDALRDLGESPKAFGHRFVHGGSAFVAPVTVTEQIESELGTLVSLAPLHNARALEAIRHTRRRYAATPNIAVFDTAFHADRSEVSMRYALPDEWTGPLSIRRYGFHGIAHASLLESAASALGVDAGSLNCITLQLGAGCSACAIAHGRSIETSMGYTPLEGLVMATRSGDIDAAIVLRLLREGYDVDTIEAGLTRGSGLVALCGMTDMREILAAEAQGSTQARLAIELFCRRIVLTVGAYLTLLGGQGSLVFGGGIGTNSASIRARIAHGLAAWDIELDTQANERNVAGSIGARGHRAVLVAKTDEESIIAKEVGRLVGASLAKL